MAVFIEIEIMRKDSKFVGEENRTESLYPQKYNAHGTYLWTFYPIFFVV